MPIFYPDILTERTEPRAFTYEEKDVMLYALGIGMGADPLDEDELAFVYERGLKVVPTVGTVLSRHVVENTPRICDGRPSQLNRLMIVAGEQKIELHKPLPTSGAFVAQSRTTGAYDKGADKGALVVRETVWTDEAGEKVMTQTGSTFARGDGGFGGPSGGAPRPHPVPDRPADLSVDLATRPDQALLYRLTGDRNPLHCDPQTARRAGFPRPILHGLCTFGIACRALLREITDFDPTRILSHQGRFSAPVFPGEVVTVDLWQDGLTVAFKARVRERNVTVLDNGMTVLRA